MADREPIIERPGRVECWVWTDEEEDLLNDREIETGEFAWVHVLTLSPTQTGFRLTADDGLEPLHGADLRELYHPSVVAEVQRRLGIESECDHLRAQVAEVTALLEESRGREKIRQAQAAHDALTIDRLTEEREAARRERDEVRAAARLAEEQREAAFRCGRAIGKERDVFRAQLHEGIGAYLETEAGKELLAALTTGSEAVEQARQAQRLVREALAQRDETTSKAEQALDQRDEAVRRAELAEAKLAVLEAQKQEAYWKHHARVTYRELQVHGTGEMEAAECDHAYQEAIKAREAAEVRLATLEKSMSGTKETG